MVAVTNVTGSNPGPQTDTLPDTVQSPVGNVWKLASFTVSLTPTTVATFTTVEKTFAVTGLLTTDLVFVNPPAALPAGTGIAGTRVSAAGVLAIDFFNMSATTTATPSSGVYTVLVVRVQPNWTAPSSGGAIDW